MTDRVDPVSDFVADYKLPVDDSWEQTRTAWKEVAIDAWLAAAQARGFTATVREILQSSSEIAYIEVDGREYTLIHPGRAPEVQARPL
ncbi:hypothetical protein [Nocardia brasiliensis]|uniref:hypothetical protein n=1 Tax=Nocardia brasiliensis TaxID=37326 RepID=UPI00245544B6|nr:hypothetical protein [Nocardia brasiliensis]